MICNKCGNTIREDAVFCPICGERVVTDTNKENFEDNKILFTEPMNHKKRKNPYTIWIILGLVVGIVIICLIVFLIIFILPKNSDKDATDTKKAPAVFQVETTDSKPTEQTKVTEEVKATIETTEPPYSISQSDLEAEIEKIRTYYYSPGSEDKKIVLDNGTDGWNYSRDYRFHNNQLVFAFIYDGTEEHRLYFKEDHMIRYIDENHVTYDYPETSKYQSWADKAIEEAYSLINDGDDIQIATPSDWLGTWTASTGENLEIYDVSDGGLMLRFNKYSETGSKISIVYPLEFDNDYKTVASEFESNRDDNWEYTFILGEGYITVTSRYPDQVFYKD